MCRGFQRRRGSSKQTVIIALIVLIAVGLGAFFLVSKPFSTQVKEGYRQATEWTADNIQEDPVGYLTWALSEVDNTEQRLQASVLGLKTKKNAAVRALERNQADQTEYGKLLDEFRDTYRSASSGRSWPVTVRNASFEENALKRKVVECNDKLKNVSTLVETYTKTKNVIDRKLNELDGKLVEVVKLKNKLSTDLEIAKVNKSVEGIDSIGDQLDAIVDASEALVSTSEEGVDLEEMIKPTGDQRVEDEFAKIMGK